MKDIELRKKAFFALLSILGFIIVYFLLISAAIFFTILCAYGGIMLIALKPSFLTLMLGIGLIGLGCLVLFFLLKFLFKKNNADTSGMKEIFEKDESKLFETIRNLSKEINTSFPKKIFLTADVNASVFYNSTFWSMFFPVRKNLQIGLGLVNSVTESEFKAILAHEFGHFSQKSMKIGSYVYNVNQIIYNLLFDNESYNSAIEKWASASDYFALFARIGVGIIRAIQFILRGVYKMVNLSYMGLSREMEFNADEVAASVAGSRPLIDSLMRLDLANLSYSNVLNFYNSKIPENIKTENIYPQHREVMMQLCETNNIKITNGLPYITKEQVDKFNRYLLVIKDQWASHPGTDERVKRLESLGYKSENSHQPAWNFFMQKERWQEELTRELFKPVVYKGDPYDITLEKFRELYQEQMSKYFFDPRYQGYYDEREISVFEVEEAVKELERFSALEWRDIINENNLEMFRKLSGLNNDMNVLEQIASGALEINTFEYDRVKFKSKKANDLLSQLKEQKEKLEKKIQEADKSLFSCFYLKAREKNSEMELKELYSSYFKSREQNSNDLEFYMGYSNDTQFISQTTSFDEIRRKMVKVKEKEKELKRRLKHYMENKELASYLDQESKNEMEKFLSEDPVYFRQPSYNEEALRLLFTGLNLLMFLSTHGIFIKKKKLLDFQMGLLN